jgi:hypothetical protein
MKLRNRFVFAAAASLVVALTGCNAQPAGGGGSGSPRTLNLVDQAGENGSASAGAIVVQKDSIRSDTYFLASERLEGRGVGTQGLDVAADFIAARFAALGLKPLPGMDGYFQPFDITSAESIDPGTSLASGEKAYKLKDEFTALSFSAEKEFAGDVVFAGYAIANKEQGYDDFAGLDVKGKVVVAMRFEPHNEKGKSRWTGDDWTANAHLETKARAASERGAAALILVNPPTYHGALADELLPFARQYVGSGITIPVLHAKRSIVDELLKHGGAGAVKELQAKIDGSGKPASVALEGVSAKGKAAIKRTKKTVKNVVAYLPGAGPTADEYVVVGSHYDHLGWGGPGSLMNAPALPRVPGVTEPGQGNPHGGGGNPHAPAATSRPAATNPHAASPHGADPHAANPQATNPHAAAAATTGPTTRPRSLAGSRTALHFGADDNASGTAAMLEIARILSHRPAPARSVVFAAFTAEESGLIGSGRFVNHSPIDLKKTAAMLNLDMVGRVRKNLVYVGGGGTAAPLKGLLKAVDDASPLEFKNMGDGGLGPSDHMSFAQKKVPVLFFFSGTHEDYHRPTDTADKVNYDGVAQVVSVGVGLIDELARMPLSKYVDAADKNSMMNPNRTGTGGEGVRRATLGIVPGYGEEEDGKGVKISGTSAGTAAEKAGLQEGDVITKIGDKPTGTLMEMSSVLATHKPGDKVKVVYLRGGKEAVVDVVLGERK